jgi:hypothetical protein
MGREIKTPLCRFWLLLFGELARQITVVSEMQRPRFVPSGFGASEMIARGMSCRLLQRTEMMTEGNRDRANALFDIGDKMHRCNYLARRE